MKNVLDEINIRFGIVEENTSELEDIAIEIIQKINIEKTFEREREERASMGRTNRLLFLVLEKHMRVFLFSF